MLTDREILDAIPTNQFDEQTKMLWFGRFIEQAVIDKLSKQEPIYQYSVNEGKLWTDCNSYVYSILKNDRRRIVYADPVPAQVAIDLNTNDRGEPDVIYLQLHDPDDTELTQKADFTGDGITWCWERIHANDVRYVREDLVFKK